MELNELDIKDAESQLLFLPLTFRTYSICLGVSSWVVGTPSNAVLVSCGNATLHRGVYLR